MLPSSLRRRSACSLLLAWFPLPLPAIALAEPMGTDLRAPVVVPDDVQKALTDKHVYPPEYEGHLASLVLEADEIRGRVRELARVINEDYRGQRPVLLCTLKGACPFYTHLSDALQDLRQGYDMEFIRASSYDGTSSTGSVVFGECKAENIQNRHVIIIEDIVDTGTTLASMVPMLRESASPASVEVCTLLDKRLDPSKKHFAAKYCGFSIPDHFIIGYGLDYNELYRDLRDIYVISKAGIDFDPKTLHSGKP